MLDTILQSFYIIYLINGYALHRLVYSSSLTSNTERLHCLQSSATCPPVSVAVRFTYQLSDWMHYSWCQPPPDITSYSGDEVGLSDFGDLPFGACGDPVR